MPALRPILFLAAAILSLVIGLTGTNPAVAPGERSAGEVASAAATVYVSLRVINAALSAAQEVELGASIGAQASVQPLRVLEPVDDTVERVAAAVFTVATGAAVATVGLAPVAKLGAVALALGLAGLAACAVRPGASHGVRPVCMRLAWLGGVLAIGVPLVFAAGVELGDRMTRANWTEAMYQLDTITEQAGLIIGAEDGSLAAIDDAETDGTGFFGRLTSAVDGARRYAGAIEYFWDEADTLFSATMTILGVFILRTLILPALLLWAAILAVRRVLVH
ncbi:hypothetical protein HKCCE3408_01775 [Rhodobacterales bacterium HKCCE3408]|nr:hypothetical protein [Rhodobacterales bacterium HKCCE3408]